MMEENLKMRIKITVDDEKEQMNIANHIHNQLIGNRDYIGKRIALSIDTDNEINLYVSKECDVIPPIVI